MNNLEHIFNAYAEHVQNPRMSLTHIVQKTKDDTGLDIDQWSDLYFGVTARQLFSAMSSGVLPAFADFTRTGHQWTYENKKEEFDEFIANNFSEMAVLGYTVPYCVFVLNNQFILPVRKPDGELTTIATTKRFPHPSTYSRGWPHVPLGDATVRQVKAHITSELNDTVEWFTK